MSNVHNRRSAAASKGSGGGGGGSGGDGGGGGKKKGLSWPVFIAKAVVSLQVLAGLLMVGQGLGLVALDVNPEQDPTK